jgi:hypothetical protein
MRAEPKDFNFKLETNYFEYIFIDICLPTAFISFGCPKETEPKKRHHETQPEISFVAQPHPSRVP